MRDGMANNWAWLQSQEAQEANAIANAPRRMRCDAIVTLLHLRRLIDDKIRSLSFDDAHDWRTVNPMEFAPLFLCDARELMDGVLFRDFWSDWVGKHDRMSAIHSRRDRADVLFQFLNQIESNDESVNMP